MILQIYALKDKDLGCFNNPYYDTTVADNSAEQMRRHLSTAPLEKVEVLRHKVLYHLGSLDDESGVITANAAPDLLFDCDSVLDVRFIKQDASSKEIN